MRHERLLRECLNDGTLARMSTYRVILIPSEEGWAVSCPALKGCHSQGATREEALENIREAIRLWLEVEEEDAARLATEDGLNWERAFVAV